MKSKLNKFSKVILSLVMVFSTLNFTGLKANAVSLYNEATSTVGASTVNVDFSSAGLNKSGTMYNLQLNGNPALCLDLGLHASSGNRYALIDTIQNSTINRIVNYWDRYSTNWNNSSVHSFVQSMIWAYQSGVSTTDYYKYGQIMKTAYDAAVGNASLYPDDTYTSWAQSALTHSNASGKLYIYSTGRSSQQRLITRTLGEYPRVRYASVSSSKEHIISESVDLDIYKTDSSTGQGLEGVTFDIYKDNVLAATKTTDYNGYASHTFSSKVIGYGSATVEYCSNYSSLSLLNQQKITGFTSRESAQAEADRLASERAIADANSKTTGNHTYKAVETSTKTQYYLNPNNTTHIQDKNGAGSLTFNITNDEQLGTVNLVKKDSKTNQGVKDAVYGLYASQDIYHPDGHTGLVHAKDSLVKTFPKTDENGKSSVSGVHIGNYYVKEITASPNYVIDTNTYAVLVAYAGQNASVTTSNVNVTEDMQTGKITITKQDDTTQHALEGAVFNLYAKNDIVHPDGHTGVIYKANQLVATFPQTDANGKTTLEGLYLGDYYAKEMTAPDQYVLDDTAKNITLSYAGQNEQVSVTTPTYTNHRQEGKITITKHDSETNETVPNAIYELYAKSDIINPDQSNKVMYKANDLVATFPKTNENGQSSLEHLYLGDYYIVEKTAPDGYVISTEKYDVTLSYHGQNVSVVTETQKVTDTVQRGTVEFVKLDKELSEGTQNPDITDGNNDGAQGDGTRVGATYGLYARHDIIHKDTKSGVVTYNQTKGSIHEIQLTKGTDLNVLNNPAKAGNLLAIAKTDSNGEIKFEHLYLGDYYIKEIEPSEGYLLDDTEYDVVIHYAGQNVEITSKNTEVFEQVKKQGFDLFKGGHVAGTSNNAKPLEGVHFEVKLESDIQRLIKEGMSLEEAKKAAPLYDELITDKNGQASSIRLPYGKYRVMETQPAVDYDTAEDFFITITEDSEVNQPYYNNVVIDEVFSAYIKAVKLDKETGKTVLLPNTEFKIKALTDVYVNDQKFSAGEYIGYWTWNPFDGFSKFDLFKGGFYVDSWKTDETGTVQLNEKLSAGEYQLEEIHAPNGYVLDTTPVQFTITNQGQYEIAEDGNPVIIAYKENNPVKGQITVEKRGEVLIGFENGQFIYEERGLANAHYEIFAKENIMDPSNDGTILYAKGTLVEEIVTDENGKAISSKLPLGEYDVVEKIAPDGFVINSQKQTVELKYKDELTEVVFEDTQFVNQRQTVEINAVKKDAETLTGLQGAEFTLYAKQDIYSVDNVLLVAKDTALETVITNENGKAKFTLDLPLNSYYVKETKAPIGYSSTDKIIDVDASYQGQEIDIIYETVEFENEITQVEVSKIASDNPNVQLEGAVLAIYPLDDKNEPILGECFETWMTTKDPHIVKGLEIGKTYRLVELSPADGYLSAKPIDFTVMDTGKLQYIEMVDEPTKVEFSKVDATTGQEIEGATLAIYPLDENGNPKLGECFETWLTDGSKHLVEHLPIGKYILRELVAPFGMGYVTADDVEFEVLDTSQVQQVKMEDDHTKIVINKVDKNGKAVSGATMAVVPMDENGNPLMGEVFETWITKADDPTTKDIDESKHKIEYLSIGKYLLVELSAPDGYVKAKPIEFEVKDTAEIQEINMIEKQVSFSKVDATTSKEVVGAEIEVIDKDGNVVDKWTSTEDVHYISGLVEGETYTLKELSAPEGYVIAEEIKFTVTDDKKEQNVTMKDIRLDVSKLNNDDNYVEGAKLQIIDSKTKNIVDEWVTTQETHYTSNLIEGHSYILKEVETPMGYVTASDVEFIVNTNKENQTIKMVDKQVMVAKIDKLTKEYVSGANLSVTDKDTGEVVDSWISDNTTHKVSGLYENKTYILSEISAPNGYHKANDIEFTVTEDKATQTLVMEDAPKIGEVNYDSDDSISGNSSVDDKTTSTKTGDEMNGMLSLITLLSSFIATLFLKKRGQRNEEE